MKGAPLVLFAILGLGSFAVGMHPPSVTRSEHGERQILDMAGRAVALAKTPRRVVVFPYVLAQYVTVQRGAANVAGASRIAAETVADSILAEFYPRLVNIPILAKGVYLQDPELLMAAAPDAVVVWSEDVPRLLQLGIPGVLARKIDPEDDLGEMNRKLWTFLGEVSGDQSRSQELLRRWRAQRKSLANFAVHPGGRTRIAMLYAGEGIGQIGGHYAHLNEAIRFIGARNPAADRLRTINSNIEELLRLDPDILLLTSDYEKSPAELYELAAWRPLSVVRQRRIYRIPQLADIDGPVDDPLFILWLAQVAYGVSAPDGWRHEFGAAYEEVYGAKLSDAQIDAVLRIRDNESSAGYSQFRADARAGT